HGAGTAVAQGQVVFGGSALVAVSLNRERDIGMLLQERDVTLQRRLLIGANRGGVIVKRNVLDVLREHLLFRCRRRWRRRRWRSIHRDSRGGILGSTWTFRCEVIRRRIRRCHLLRTTGLNGADSINADVGGVRRLPAQRG